MNTSRAYLTSHVLLRSEVYNNWKNFSENLNQGPIRMKKYLLDLWNSIDEKKLKDGVEITDINRVVTENDFNVTVNTFNNIRVFFIIFPDPDRFDAEAKAVAIALTPKIPRYFTMEVWTENEILQKYTFGEWIIEDNKFKHVNKGRLPRETIECFATYVEDALYKA